MNERRQFSTLVRTFAGRFLDVELITAQGDLKQTLGQIAALLGALGICVAVAIIQKQTFVLSRLPYATRRVVVWPEQELLIALTMAVVGVTTVLLSDHLFPDRRDCLVLGPLPVRMRTMLASKLAAVGGTVALAAVALNAITALTFPFVLVPDDGGVLNAARALLVHAISVTAAALFVFFAVMAMRGALTALVSPRLFDRAAAYVQFALLLLVIAAFFLRPPVRASVELAASGRAWMWPNIWFFGFYEVLLGSGAPVLQILAGRAAAMFLLSMAGAAVGLYLAYLRRVRRPLDQPETSTARERIGAGNLFRAPRERALLNFTLRALLRSRQHRTLLALYAGVGVSCSLIGLAHVIYDSQPVNWTRPSAALLAPPLLLMFFVMLGVRAAFAIPIELRGNWIFQLVGTTKPGECRRVAASALLLVGCLPALFTTAPVYLVLWRWRDAIAHLGFVLLVALLLARLLTRRWAKIPFTCSFQPGKADLKVKFGLYGVAFIVAVALVLQIELRALASARAYATVAGLVALALIALSRRRDQAGERLVFDDQPVPLVRTLGLGV